jgi:type VI protein secretion system component Hcp
VGIHNVIATGRVGRVEKPGSARFIIDPAPTPTTTTHTSAPTPTPTPSATATCEPDQVHVTGSTGYLLAPPLVGGGSEPGFAGGFAVTALTPASALPLGVDLVGAPPVTLTVKVDAESQALAQAVMQGKLLPCVRVDLPGGPGYLWVNYAFANVLLSAFQLGGGGGGDNQPTATLVLNYASASFAYQPADGDLVTGTDDAAVVVPTPTSTSACQPDQAHATGSTGYLLAPPLAGGGSEPGFVGGIAVTALAPGSALPLGVNLVGTPPVTLTVVPDAAWSGLTQAVASGKPFACVRVDLPGGSGYAWANYAFANVLLSSLQIGDGDGGDGPPKATLVLHYTSASFAYQPTDGDVVTGTDAAAVDPSDPSFPWLWVGGGVGFVLAAGGGIAWWLLKHRPHTV